jgi:L-ascorbate metabolism protein UlaG (beta-lactamase superfamily)
MKAAFEKNTALLARLATSRAAGRAGLWWLGQSGFLFQTPRNRILFDPYLSDSLTRKYDGTDKPHVRVTERVVAPEALQGIQLVTSSHNHTDHLDRETLLPLLAVNPEARLVAPRANREFVLQRLGIDPGRLVPLDAGESATLGDLTIHAVAAAHNEVERDDSGCCRYLGYVLETPEWRVYHSGDTRLHDGLVGALQPFRVDVALVPINGNRPERRVAGNLTGAEAAWLSRQIGSRLAIPHHFDTFAFNTEPPDEFERECRRLGQAFRTLRHGEGVELGAGL